MNRWKVLDKVEDTIKQKQIGINKQTQDEIQNIFNEIDLNSFSYINNNQKQKLTRFINKYKDKGIYAPYVLYLANKILSKKNVSQKDVLEVKLLLVFDNQYQELDEINQIEFKKIISEAYIVCASDLKEKDKKADPSILLEALLLSLLAGYIYQDYIFSRIVYDAEQIKRQTLINNLQGKKSNIDDIEFQKIIDKQNKEYLNINDEKRSGFIELIGTSIFTEAYLKACDEYKTQKVRFYNPNDEKTTKMCSSLDGQEFYMRDWNEFYRYDDDAKSVTKHKIYGLVEGINQPPIANHIHYCRSWLVAIKNN